MKKECSHCEGIKKSTRLNMEYPPNYEYSYSVGDGTLALVSISMFYCPFCGNKLYDRKSKVDKKNEK